MKEYIDKLALLSIYEMQNYPWVDTEDMFEIAQKFPTADVVEVVRCGECIHSKERKIKDTVICSKYNAYKDINGFCEIGEKK